MDPIALLTLVAAAGFVFKKFSSQARYNDESEAPELKYKPKIFATANRILDEETDLDEIEILPEYQVVYKLVESGFPLIFVTGGAGTGKSTFVKWMTKRFNGQVLLGAPTGVAAVNIEGKTLSSLCQLPPAWIVKTDIKQAPHRREIQQAKLLIIDEISMVNANLLDGVSAFFRFNRKIDKAFGGLPVVLVGDMFQLPPAINKETKDLFQRVYGTAKFYNAKSLGSSPYYAVELGKTFRQSDQSFVDLLTDIREGRNLPTALAKLNSECSITSSPPGGAVWLSPRNAEVNTINARELQALDNKEFLFHGVISGLFKNDRLPSPMILRLKKGAQVMFTQNDKKKRWINGSVGIVNEVYENEIVVKLTPSGKCIDVERAIWLDFRYEWNAEEQTIARIETGSYAQFPLILAWASTIHKSQGKTINRVHLDLGAGAFDTGQTYVALSRCRSISGLSMSRPLRESDILVDQESVKFYDHLRAIIEKLPPKKMLEKLHHEDNLRATGNDVAF
ncbi:MAG: Tetratricopeptide (TPR) protein [uncultured bacterium]|nr:MAG: Tetratricopeptide (TPR) protein [uncultured bacterium]